MSEWIEDERETNAISYHTISYHKIKQTIPEEEYSIRRNKWFMLYGLGMKERGYLKNK